MCLYPLFNGGSTLAISVFFPLKTTEGSFTLMVFLLFTPPPPSGGFFALTVLPIISLLSGFFALTVFHPFSFPWGLFCAQGISSV